VFGSKVRQQGSNRNVACARRQAGALPHTPRNAVLVFAASGCGIGVQGFNQILHHRTISFGKLLARKRAGEWGLLGSSLPR